MDQFTERDMHTHVPILAWLLIVSNAILFVIGAFVFVLLTGIGAVSGDREAFAILGIVATAVSALLVVLGVPGVLAGVGLLRRRNWGRVLAVVVSALGLLNFPIGTIIGAYALWVLLQHSGEQYFASQG